MQTTIDQLLTRMCDPQEKEAYLYADKLSKIGNQEVIDKLIEILKSENYENAQLAARALGKIQDNQPALDHLFEVIHRRENQLRNGSFVQTLEGYDLSEKFVDLFRLYLFGNFKTSALAKELLDTVEFELTPRVLKKLEKHWNHFKNNIDQNSEEFEIKRSEVEEMMEEIKQIFSENE
ncbi:HEAT repeat domain-containing protein [Arthrospiribacter ruber]|uniref:HEAT repeat domain-containing protein n=1 Tax=Arthrospiribacter ruber TaxID=2487934 RepID=A0A951MEP9_9BACT|nr:HEAT repeat domain-containing protein [Arthrospiribacter ruber]MBW3468051.1 HEAT repeat domain-containing protein [Arthrospiribacter ruber]